MNGDNESGIGSAQGIQAGSSENAEQTGIVVGKSEAATKPTKPTKPTKSAKAPKAEKKAGKTSHPAKGKGTKTASKGGKAPKSAMKTAVNAPKATAAGKAKDGKAPKDAKPAIKAAKASKANGNVPDICPFRATSSYAALWTILHAAKDGMTRPELIAEGVKVTGKPEKNVGFDVSVVLSPKEDGTAHPSANRAADKYYVARAGDSYKLHLR